MRFHNICKSYYLHNLRKVYILIGNTAGKLSLTLKGNISEMLGRTTLKLGEEINVLNTFLSFVPNISWLLHPP